MSLKEIPPPLPIFSTLFGLLLVGLGWLLIAEPWLLSYVVASMLIFAGVATIVSAWGMRGRMKRGQFVTWWRLRD